MNLYEMTLKEIEKDEDFKAMTKKMRVLRENRAAEMIHEFMAQNDSRYASMEDTPHWAMESDDNESINAEPYGYFTFVVGIERVRGSGPDGTVSASFCIDNAGEVTFAHAEDNRWRVWARQIDIKQVFVDWFDAAKFVVRSWRDNEAH